jgi:hypothetical protein
MNTWNIFICTQGYYKCFRWQEISAFSKRLQLQAWNNMKTRRKLIELSMATLIVTYQPRLALRSLSVSNDVSSANTLIPGAELISWPTRFPDLTPCGDIRLLGCQSPFASKFHRPWLTPISHSFGVHGHNLDMTTHLSKSSRYILWIFMLFSGSFMRSVLYSGI